MIYDKAFDIDKHFLFVAKTEGLVSAIKYYENIREMLVWVPPPPPLDGKTYKNDELDFFHNEKTKLQYKITDLINCLRKELNEIVKKEFE